MEYRWVGRTGLHLSRFGIGTGAFPEEGAPEHGAKLLVDAARAGVTFWDTANNYDTYREIRLALKRLDHQGSRIVISSKIEAKTVRGATRQVRRCLREVGRNWIDLMLLHYVQEPLARWQGAIETVRRAKQQGEVLAMGISTHNPRYVREAVASGVMDCMFVTLNVAGSWVEGRGGNADMIRACQEAKRAGLGIVLLKALGNGGLVGQRRRALRWAFSRPFADSVIVGVETLAQLREDVRDAGL